MFFTANKLEIKNFFANNLSENLNKGIDKISGLIIALNGLLSNIKKCQKFDKLNHFRKDCMNCNEV
jgi:hypothetical protein